VVVEPLEYGDGTSYLHKILLQYWFGDISSE